MATVDFPEQIKELDATLTSIEKVLDLDAMRAEITELQEEVGAPDLWDDQINAQRVTGRLSTLQADLERITGLRQRLDDLEIMVQLGQEEDDAESLVEAENELGRLHAQIESLEVRTLLSGEYDERDAIVSIRSGAGGVDAADFAEMLQRMYVRWAERHQLRGRDLRRLLRRGGRPQVHDVRHQGALRLRNALGRGRHPPARPHLAVRQPGPSADVVRRGRGGAGAGGDR